MVFFFVSRSAGFFTKSTGRGRRSHRVLFVLQRGRVALKIPGCPSFPPAPAHPIFPSRPMPKGAGLQSIPILGSGPIVISRAAESTIRDLRLSAPSRGGLPRDPRQQQPRVPHRGERYTGRHKPVELLATIPSSARVVGGTGTCIYGHG
jgi:hypothetical protein